MRRSLVLRRDVLADLTPADLAAVVGAQQETIPCATRRCQAVALIKYVLEDQTVLCPMSAGCPPVP